MKSKLFLIIFITLTFFLCGLLCFQKNEQIQTKKLENENVLFSLFQGEEKVNTIPSKDSGYYFDRDKSNCTNDAQIEWDSVNWSPSVSVKDENQERVSCNLYFTTNYREGILNGTDPVLKDEMVPITLENDGTVKKADLTKPWYSYADKKWANAVILQNSYDTLDAEGKVNGATKQDGYVSFDGVDDTINLGLTNYDFGTQLTIGIAVTFYQNPKTVQEYFNNYEAAGFGFYLSGSSEKINVFQLRIENNYYQISSTTLEFGKKYLIVGTYNGKSMKMYINGELVSEQNISGNIVPSTLPLTIGANPEKFDAFSSYSKLNVHQAVVFNRTLSEDEIKNNMTNEIKVTDNKGLLKYVDFTNKQNYETNEIIPEDVIESYFVWIPKYRYKLWDLGNYSSLTSTDTSKVHTIDILFGDYDTSDSVGKECTTPMTSGATGNCKVGDYMTHPAFIGIPSTGFWVGKFETGYKGATTTSSAQSNTYDISKIEVKPNVYSWRSTQIVNGHLNSYNYKRNLDSHMIKNTEWGAIAYLQHSFYGSQTQIRLNNTDSHLTGYAANSAPTCGYTGKKETCIGYCENDSCSSAYNTEIGYLASTTGNISGVYDMSGGDWEYVMLFTKNSENKILVGKNSTYNSGFSGINYDGTTLVSNYNLPDDKYYDLYNGTASGGYYDNKILGDAIGETGPFGTINYSSYPRTISSWYNNQAVFISYETPFLVRGGATTIGANSGIFTFDNQYGQPCSAYRIILTPTKGNVS